MSDERSNPDQVPGSNGAGPVPHRGGRPDDALMVGSGEPIGGAQLPEDTAFDPLEFAGPDPGSGDPMVEGGGLGAPPPGPLPGPGRDAGGRPAVPYLSVVGDAAAAEAATPASTAVAVVETAAAPPAGPPALPFSFLSNVPEGEEAGMATMSYREHLEELRDRLVKSIIAMVIGIAVSFLFTEAVFTALKSRAEGVTLIRTGVAEMIGTYIKVAFISGVVLSTPVWLYQVVMFVAPGLTSKEKRFLYAALPFVLGSFLLGVLFAFFILLPPAMNFLIHFGEDIAQPLIRVGDYVSVVTSLLLWIGIVFELPIVLYVLARLGIVTPAVLKQKRPYAIAGAFVLAALITPTVDPVNQSIVALPIILLYEIGILLSYAAVRARGKAEPAAA